MVSALVAVRHCGTAMAISTPLSVRNVAIAATTIVATVKARRRNIQNAPAPVAQIAMSHGSAIATSGRLARRWRNGHASLMLAPDTRSNTTWLSEPTDAARV